MATLYSLVCFGGKNGKTVTMTIASPCVVTLTNHGLRDGTGVVFSTTGALPTGVTAGTTYYTRSTASNTFNLYDTAAHAIAGGSTGRVNTSGSQSGTHTIKSKVMIDLMATYPTRWGAVGSERIYDGYASWVSGRSGASNLDTEVLEIGQNFVDTLTTSLTHNIPCASARAETKLAGVRTEAFHGGVVDAGYTLYQSTNSSNVLTISQPYVTVDGFTIKTGSGWFATTGLRLDGFADRAINMVIMGPGGYTSVGANGYGIFNATYGQYIVNNVVTGWLNGFYINAFMTGILVANNTATKNGTGFYPQSSTTNTNGYFYNNISVGNTTNWGSTAGFTAATGNAGLSGEAWKDATGTRITIATTDFYGYGSTPIDLRAANSSSPQVETGIEYYLAPTYDIADAVRPNYMNGSAAYYDVGAYEFDHGYGLAPITVTFSNLVSGSTVRIFTTGTQTVLASTTSSGTSYNPSGLGVATVDYQILKDGYIPIRVTGVTLYDGLTIDGTQTLDRAYQASSGLTYGTTATINTSTKIFTIGAATTGQNWYSFWIEQFRSNSALYNTAFPLQANGPNSFTLRNGYEFSGSSDLAYISRDGIRYTNTSGTMTASWAAVLSVGVPAGHQVRYIQSDGGSPTNAVNTGNIDQLIQIYGDASHGNFDRRSFLVCKVQKQGYDQAEVDVVAQYGNLEDQLYVVGLTPVANGVATGNPGITGVTITDHGASPVTWNSKVFSITITDSGTNSGTDILRWLRYNFETGGTFQGTNAFNWHDLMQTNGTKFKGVRGALYGDTGATLKGVRVLRGTSAHPDVDLHTADDGTTYSSAAAIYQSVTISGLVSGSRVQIYDTTHSTELSNAVVSGTVATWTDSTPAASSRAIRVRIAYVSGASAKNFIEANIGTCGTSSADAAVSYLASQTADTVYNANAISGSGVTGVTFTDASPDVVNVDVSTAGEISLADIYAAWVYYASTSTGIATDIDYIEAIDQANYVFSNMVIKNTSSPSVPLKITGGYAWDSVTLDPIDIVDSTGGTLFLAPPHVVAKTITITGGNVITGDIADVPTAAEIAAATLTAAQAAPIHADTKKMNGATVRGTGTSGDKWRG